jgi:hypothetical protein
MDLLLATVLLFQDKTRDLLQENSAEETFKKIEETIEKAKTVSVKLRMDLVITRKNTEEALAASGTLLLKEKSKASLVLAFSTIEGVKQYGVYCEGAKVRTVVGKLEQALENASGTLNNNLSFGLTRTGVVYADFLFHPANLCDRIETRPRNLRRDMELCEFKKGEDDKDEQTILYMIRDEDEAVTYETRLWFDPKTNLPRKQALSFKLDHDQVRITETYEQLTLDADIPDEKFKLPSDK